MPHRWIRVTLVIALIAIGIGAAFFLDEARRQTTTARASHLSVDSTLDRMVADLADLGAAQLAYVAPGQADRPWLTRATSRLEELQAQAVALRDQLRTPEAAANLEGFNAGLDALRQADGRIREYLRSGDDLMATDLIFSEARESLASLMATLRALKRAERVDREDTARTQDRNEAAVLLAVAGVWVLGLLALALAPRSAPAIQASPADDAAAPDPTAGAGAQAGASASADLSRAAEVCAGLARLTDAGALPSMLAKAAAVMDASGVIIWLGAGDKLVAASAHGYDARVLAKVGAIPRAADNATAEAWRQGELRTVAAGTDTNGAIVAPMVGHDGCRGVLAVEVRNGRERDSATCAVASMFASQLAGLVAGLPAATVEAPESALASAERAS